MIEVTIDGIKVRAMLLDSNVWFHWKGETIKIPLHAGAKIKSQTRRGHSSTVPASGQVVAPMPGKITQLRVAVGDLVTVGQVVLVMEAMKMEYTLKAPRAGTVESLVVKVGQQVSAEAVLAEIGDIK